MRACLSYKAHNRGLPATPRDGADVEIIGLLKSTLRFITRLPEEYFPYKTVTTSSGKGGELHACMQSSRRGPLRAQGKEKKLPACRRKTRPGIETERGICCSKNVRFLIDGLRACLGVVVAAGVPYMCIRIYK